MSLDASVGTITSNSYVTADEADAYFLDRAHSDQWTASTSKESLLITVSRMLDWQLKFQGVKTLDVQGLKFPRTGIVLSSGYSVPSDTIPTEIKNATFELALLFVEGDRTLDSDLAGIDEVKAGPLFIKSVTSGYLDTSPKIIPQYIKTLLSEYTISGGMSVVRLERA